MGRNRYKIFDEKQLYFFTVTILHWIPVFTRKETVQIVLDSLTYLTENDSLKVQAYVILENNIHLISRSDNILKDISRFKRHTARKILNFLKYRNAKTILDQLKFYKKSHKNHREFQLWQEGSCPKLIKDEKRLNERIEYIHQNPVKRGYVDEATHWGYSSARDYDGKQGLINVEKGLVW